MSKQLVQRTSVLVAIIMVFSVFICIPVKADTVNYVHTSPFTDVNTNHWAIRHIMKMNIREVASGYTDGSFKPDKAVKQLEAVLMAVRNLDCSEEISSINSNRSLPFSVPQWASEDYKKELLFAVERGLIVPSEDNFDAQSYASRAWIAQLIVRMIDKEDECSGLARKTTSFKDDSSIPIWSLGYINVALKYELISGYPDNSFKPYKNVSRAEALALFNRSEEYLDLSDSIMNARILDISANAFTLIADKKAYMLSMDSSTWYFDKGHRMSSWTSLAKGNSIKCILKGDKVLYAEQLDEKSVYTTLTGRVLHVMADENVLVVKDEDNDKIITASVSTDTTITTEGGGMFILNQIEPGTDVELSFDNRNNLISIILQGQHGNFSNTGVIYEINLDQKLLIMKNSQGTFVSYQWNSSVEVNIEGKRFASIEDLQEGDEIKVSIDDDILSGIQLVKAQQELSASGKIMVVSPEKDLVVIEVDGEPQTYYLDSDTEISIDGIKYPLVSDLQVDDQVDLNINEGKLESIEVKNRQVSDFLLEGTVVAVDSSNRMLVVNTKDDENKAYEFNDTVEIELDDEDDARISDIEKDMQVEFQLFKDKIIYLTICNGLKGTVSAINEDRHILTLTLDNGDSRTYFVSKDVDVDIEDGGDDLDDVNRGDYVEVKIDDERITDIDVERSFIYEIYKIYESSDKLKVYDEDGDKKSGYIYLKRHVDLIIPGESSPDIDDLSEEDTIRVTYLGTKETKVELMEQIYGEITRINSSNSEVTVETQNGKIKKYDFDSKSRVMDGSHERDDLDSLEVGDRVQVVEGTGGKLSFKLMKQVSGKFVNTDSGKNKIYITKYNSSSYTYYKISNNCYIHDGDKNLRLKDLDKNDQLDLYVIDNIVYDVERK